MNNAREAQFVHKKRFYELFVADEPENEEVVKSQGTVPSIKRSKRVPASATTEAHADRQPLQESKVTTAKFEKTSFRKVREASARLFNVLNDDDANSSNQSGIMTIVNPTPPTAASDHRHKGVGHLEGYGDSKDNQVRAGSCSKASAATRPIVETNIDLWWTTETLATSPESQKTKNNAMESDALLEVPSEELYPHQGNGLANGNSQTASHLAFQKPEPSVEPPTSSCSSAIIPNSTQCTTFDDYVRMQKTKKQKHIIRLTQQDHGIFQGSCFMFIPNNEVAIPRRNRIRKSLEHGAVWAREYGPFVTHIIADDELSFGDVVKWLQIEHIPATLQVLKASYIPWCLEWRRAMDPSRTMHVLHPSPMQRSEHSKHTEASFKDSEYSPTQLDATSSTKKLTQSKPISGGEPARYSACDPLVEIADLARLEKDFHLDPNEEADACEGVPHRQMSKITPETTENGDFESLTSVTQWQRSFSCVQGGSSESKAENPNTRTIGILQGMLNYYDSTSDEWRIVAYRKAISALKRQTEQVTTKAEAEKIPGIGISIAAKIEEIVFTNRLRKLEATKDNEADQALALFLDIYGVGYQQASKWVQKGHRTIEDVVKFESLNGNQKVGVEHFEDFRTRIPRAEVKECCRIVTSVLLSIDEAFEVLVAGSYRRGASDSGDIDLIITRPEKNMHYIRTIVHGRLVPLLYKQGFLTATLADMSKESSTKWHGACQIPKATENSNPDDTSDRAPWRRIDFLLVPPKEFGAAMLYFTGNDIFNRSMRLLARKKGLCLNQHGLFKDVIRTSHQTKLNDGVLVESRSERRIFELLGVPWREPQDRSC